MTSPGIRDEVRRSLLGRRDTWRSFWIGLAVSLVLASIGMVLLDVLTDRGAPWGSVGMMLPIFLVASVVFQAIGMRSKRNITRKERQPDVSL